MLMAEDENQEKIKLCQLHVFFVFHDKLFLERRCKKNCTDVPSLKEKFI